MGEWQKLHKAPHGKWLLVHYSKEVTDADPNWDWDEQEDSRTIVARRGDGYWEAPDEPDEIPCSQCGECALDTGWECNDCGHDMRPEIYPEYAEGVHPTPETIQ